MINISKKTIKIALIAIAATVIIIGSLLIYNKISNENLTNQKHQQYIEKVHQENFNNENSRYDQ